MTKDQKIIKGKVGLLELASSSAMSAKPAKCSAIRAIASTAFGVLHKRRYNA
jgi:hypothetical protein